MKKAAWGGVEDRDKNQGADRRTLGQGARCSAKQKAGKEGQGCGCVLHLSSAFVFSGVGQGKAGGRQLKAESMQVQVGSLGRLLVGKESSWGKSSRATAGSSNRRHQVAMNRRSGGLAVGPVKGWTETQRCTALPGGRHFATGPPAGGQMGGEKARAGRKLDGMGIVSGRAR